jgi:hypothetical protein
MSRRVLIVGGAVAMRVCMSKELHAFLNKSILLELLCEFAA